MRAVAPDGIAVSAGRLTRQTTSWPRETSARTVARPIVPVAPRKRTRRGLTPSGRSAFMIASSRRSTILARRRRLRCPVERRKRRYDGIRRMIRVNLDVQLRETACPVSTLGLRWLPLSTPSRRETGRCAPCKCATGSSLTCVAQRGVRNANLPAPSLTSPRYAAGRWRVGSARASGAVPARLRGTVGRGQDAGAGRERGGEEGRESGQADAGRRMPGAAAQKVVAGGETGEAESVTISGQWGADPRRRRRQPAGLIVSRAPWPRTPDRPSRERSLRLAIGFEPVNARAIRTAPPWP